MIGNKIKSVHPYSYRSGEDAIINAVVMYAPKVLDPMLCCQVEFKDGVTDYIPVCDGANYKIEVIDND